MQIRAGHLFVTLILCSFNHLNSSAQLSGKWLFVDSHWSTGGAGRIISFTEDSLIIDNLGISRSAFYISSIDEQTIVADEYGAMNYLFQGDTLILSNHDAKQKLLPFAPIGLDVDAEELGKLLAQSRWELGFEHGPTWDIFFNNRKFKGAVHLTSHFREDIRFAEVDHYYKSKYQNSQDIEAVWKVVNYQGQLVCRMEFLSANDYWPTTYFIEDITPQLIIAKAWSDGVAYPIRLTKRALIGQNDLQNRTSLLQGHWRLVNSSEIEYPIDTTGILVDIGKLDTFYEEPIKPQLVFNQVDLETKLVRYQFEESGMFELGTSSKKVKAGQWQIRRNGEVVQLKAHLIDYWDYEIPCHNLRIKTLTMDTLVIEHTMPMWESDSTFNEVEYQLTFIRSQ